MPDDMCRGISLEVKMKVLELLPNYSLSEIASITGITSRSVLRIKKAWNIEKTPENIRQIRSRIRKKTINDERRRIIFGHGQKTNLKVFSNPQKHSLKYRLKRVGYLKSDDPNTYLYDDSTKRNQKYEKMCLTYGIKILPLNI